MYNCIKKLVLRILPRRVLFNAEPFLRGLYCNFYRGNQFQCNICGKKLRRFISLPGNDLLCPNCGSIARDRRLWSLLERCVEENTVVLDFSPSRSLFRKMKSLPEISYISTDLSGDFMADRRINITDIDFETGSFDLVVCYHILEHIEDDAKAISELYRILKDGGYCLIQTPFREGEIYEDLSIKSDQERLEHFGQEDHVRIYSVKGLRDRLSAGGFEVEIKIFREAADNIHGFSRDEAIMVCTN